MKKIGLSTKVFIGFGLGVLLGIIFKEKALIIKPIGTIFLRLIKMIVVPMVFFSIMGGVASIGDIKKLRRVGGKTLLYYIVTTAFAGIIGLAVGKFIQPGIGFQLEMVGNGTVEAQAAPALMDTLINMIPLNPVQSLVEGNLMQIIVFAIFVGVGITILGEKADPVKNFCDAMADVMYKVTAIVMEFSPIGVTALIAASVGEYGVKIFGPLSKLILSDYIAMILIIMVMYLPMLIFIGKVRPADFFKSISKIWAVTASTTSSSGTLPVTLKTVEDDFRVKPELAGFTLPLGATMNMNGAAAYFGVTVVFVAQIYGVDLSVTQQLMTILMATMISVGAPGIPGGGIVLTVMLLNTMGLPVEIMGLIAGIYRILDMGHTSLNVTGDVVSTLCIARTEDAFIHVDQRIESVS